MKTLHDLWHLLNAGQRRTATALLGLMLVGMMLETLGVGLVVPAISLMTHNGLATKYPFVASWLDLLGNPSQERLIIVGMAILVGIYAVKAAFLAVLAWRQSSFVSGLQAELSRRLFAGYLRQPYTFHLQRNSAQLIRNTISQSGNVGAIFQHVLTVLAEVLVMLGLSALLLVVEPLGALVVVSTLGIAGWGVYRLTRTHLLRWGEAMQVSEGFRIQYLQEGLGGAKDVKLLGREAGFLAQYQIHNARSARLSQRQSTLQALPRLWLEFLAVTGLAGLIVTMILQGDPLGALLPTVGLFTAAAFRLMPSVNRVLNALQTVRFALPMIDNVCSELRLIDETKITPSGVSAPLRKSLCLEQVSFNYPQAESAALGDISLSIECGTSVGIIGSSGAGKSTLVDVMLGLLTPVNGCVILDGVDIQRNLRGWQDQIGYVPQSIFLTDDTLRRNVAFGVPNEEIDDVALMRSVRAAQLEQFVAELPSGIDTLVGERGIRLSGGQRQRIGIARALYHDPSVLVLDEATSSLDIATEKSVMNAVRALKGSKTIIIVAHRLSTVEKCDRIFRLERGHLVQEGVPKEMLGPVQSS